MSAIQTLIDQTYSYSVEDENLSDAYLDDMKQFQEVQLQITFGDYDEASKVVDDMDTEPREQIIMALVADLGSSVVADKFGYEVA